MGKKRSKITDRKEPSKSDLWSLISVQFLKKFGRAEKFFFLLFLVAVMVWFVGSILRNTKIFGLVLAQSAQFHSQCFQVASSDLFIEFLIQHENSNLVFSGVGPQINLSKYLVCKWATHHKSWKRWEGIN